MKFECLRIKIMSSIITRYLISIWIFHAIKLYINKDAVSTGTFEHFNVPLQNMMLLSNGNIFRVTGPLCGEFTDYRWIPLTKASDAERWCFLWSVPE